jgi:hypothetical protein
MCALNFIVGDLCQSTKSTVTGRQMKTLKYNLPQSGSFVVFSCFRPVPPDAKYKSASIKFLIKEKRLVFYLQKIDIVHVLVQLC